MPPISGVPMLIANELGRTIESPRATAKAPRISVPNVPILMPFSLADTPKPEAVTHGRNTPITTSTPPMTTAMPARFRAETAWSEGVGRATGAGPGLA